MSFVLGLTGQTGAGKTTVSQILRRAGFPVIDADGVARAVVEPGRPALLTLAETFGEEILREGRLDRRRLGQIVFADKGELMRLNAIMFPHICREIEAQIKALDRAGEKAVVLDAPVLFESGAQQLCDSVCGVIAPVEVRCARIMDRDSLRREEAMDRIRSQHGDAFFYQNCDIIIENSGSLRELEESARKLAHMLKGRLCQDD
ncbi:dephospho-CoA kinase [Zongyangia hominis]|uniref:Dephospho-CoA kinase n=1 Tax=Zongyangia hominis TaxID=2763677 RepID=A0A926EAE5_9FIRM|nr:dephospho-CoA kinase [Zongyangia hominis]MBC8570163.1 dephospho-CoA kinase [Zongyangia hominis]